MLEPVCISVSVGYERQTCTWLPIRPVVLGRQEDLGEPIGQIIRRDAFDRLAVLPFAQVDVSRAQLRITPVSDGRFQVENLKGDNTIRLGDGSVLTKESLQQFLLPLRLLIANSQIDLDFVVQTLSQTTRLVTSIPNDFRSAITTSFKTEETAEFVSFLNAMTSAFQMAPDETTLCLRACDALKQLIDVDGAAVFHRDGWTPIAGDIQLQPHLAALDRVNHERRVTWRNDSPENLSITAPHIECYVAAPIVSNNEAKTIYAAIYAHRVRGSKSNRTPLTEMQARLVEFVACAVAAGIARMQLEKQTSRFGGFFPPALARKLIAGDDILQASKREVTLMFCDIRRFSAICECIGPELASEWIGDILSELSQCIQDCEGVLVDYMGDEILAMWGAPEKLSYHADLACRAAILMFDILPDINKKWRSRIHSETEIGIGINSGEVSVGNTGSRQRFKYGPLGDAVNRASRVQGLTKHLRIPILITSETKRQLTESYSVRRVGNAKVINIEESLELFELISPSRKTRFDGAIFEQAVRCLENDQPGNAAELLRPHLDFHNPDYPTLLLFKEIINRLINELPQDSYEWNFGTK